MGLLFSQPDTKRGSRVEYLARGDKWLILKVPKKYDKCDENSKYANRPRYKAIISLTDRIKENVEIKCYGCNLLGGP